jgi:hypothetical protein
MCVMPGSSAPFCWPLGNSKGHGCIAGAHHRKWLAGGFVFTKTKRPLRALRGAPLRVVAKLGGSRKSRFVGIATKDKRDPPRSPLECDSRNVRNMKSQAGRRVHVGHVSDSRGFTRVIHVVDSFYSFRVGLEKGAWVHICAFVLPVW